MEFPDNSFDGLYALESTLYAKKPVDVYSEVCNFYAQNMHNIMCPFVNVCMCIIFVCICVHCACISAFVCVCVCVCVCV